VIVASFVGGQVVDRWMATEYFLGMVHLAGGVVLTGGGSLLSGTAELATEIFNLPARVGYPVKLGGLIEEYYSPIYATGVGLVLFGASKTEHEHLDTSSGDRIFNTVWERMRNWLKEFF